MYNSYQAQQGTNDDGGQGEENVRHPGRQTVLLGDGRMKIAKNHRHLNDEKRTMKL